MLKELVIENSNIKCKPILYEVDHNGCWILKSHSLDRDGYGIIKRVVNGVTLHRAHRLIYYVYVDNTITKSDIIRHMCNNTFCINYNHLLKGSHSDNMNDRKKSGNYYGEMNGMSKLNSEKVLEIKDMILKGLSNKEISKKFNISSNTVYDIKRGRTWTNVTGFKEYEPKYKKSFEV